MTTRIDHDEKEERYKRPRISRCAIAKKLMRPAQVHVITYKLARARQLVTLM